MKIQYTLQEEDYLKFQLYIASRSKQVKTRRFLGQYIIPVAYLLLGASLYMTNDNIGPIVFASLAVVWFFMYPIYDRSRYIRYYRKFNKENYSENFGKPMSIEDGEKELLLVTPHANSSIEYSAITEINDLGSHYLIHFSMGTVSILPINREVSRPVCDEFINAVVAKSGKSVYDKKDWEWK